MDKRGMASIEELEELYGLLVRALHRDLAAPAKRAPAIEMLSTTRKLLRDAGYTLPHDGATQKVLAKLQRRYLEAVVQAFDSPEPPSAALLQESRQLLQWAGYHPNHEPQAASSAASQLLALDLPFRILH